ncbi:MAG: hypothetical protein WCH11_00515 [Bdellovibrio sp.]
MIAKKISYLSFFILFNFLSNSGQAQPELKSRIEQKASLESQDQKLLLKGFFREVEDIFAGPSLEWSRTSTWLPAIKEKYNLKSAAIAVYRKVHQPEDLNPSIEHTKNLVFLYFGSDWVIEKMGGVLLAPFTHAASLALAAPGVESFCLLFVGTYFISKNYRKLITWMRRKSAGLLLAWTNSPQSFTERVEKAINPSFLPASLELRVEHGINFDQISFFEKDRPQSFLEIKVNLRNDVENVSLDLRQLKFQENWKQALETLHWNLRQSLEDILSQKSKWYLSLSSEIDSERKGRLSAQFAQGSVPFVFRKFSPCYRFN